MLAWLARHFPALRRIYGLPQLFDTFLLAGTLLFHKERVLAVQAVEKTLLSWPGVTTRVHRFGGVEFNLGHREIGHLHSHGLLDIPFTRQLRDDAIRAGLAQPHHILPRSAWVSFFPAFPGRCSHRSASAAPQLRAVGKNPITASRPMWLSRPSQAARAR